MGIVDWEPRTLPSEARCERWAKQGGAFLACDVHGAVMVMPSPAEPREYAFAASSAEGGVRVRPWLKGEPAGWNATFYPMTHPPIPEGWEAVGEWFAVKDGVVLAVENHWLSDNGTVSDGWPAERPAYMICLRRTLPAIPEGWEARSEWVARGMHVPAASGPEDCVLLEDGRVVAWIPNDYAGTFRAVRKVPPPADWGDVPKGVELRPDCGFGGARNEIVINGAHVGRVFDKTDGVYHTHTTNHEPVAGSPFATLPAAIVALTGRRE